MSGTHPGSVTLIGPELTPAGLRAARARHPGRTLRAVVPSGRLDARRYLDEAEFVPVRATWTGEIELARADARTLGRCLDRARTRASHVGPVPPGAFDDWLVHHGRCHEEVHRINPVASAGSARRPRPGSTRRPSSSR